MKDDLLFVVSPWFLIQGLYEPIKEYSSAKRGAWRCYRNKSVCFFDTHHHRWVISDETYARTNFNGVVYWESADFGGDSPLDVKPGDDLVKFERVAVTDTKRIRRLPPKASSREAQATFTMKQPSYWDTQLKRRAHGECLLTTHGALSPGPHPTLPPMLDPTSPPTSARAGMNYPPIDPRLGAPLATNRMGRSPLVETTRPANEAWREIPSRPTVEVGAAHHAAASFLLMDATEVASVDPKAKATATSFLFAGQSTDASSEDSAAGQQPALMDSRRLSCSDTVGRISDESEGVSEQRLWTRIVPFPSKAPAELSGPGMAPWKSATHVGRMSEVRAPLQHDEEENDDNGGGFLSVLAGVFSTDDDNQKNTESTNAAEADGRGAKPRVACPTTQSNAHAEILQRTKLVHEQCQVLIKHAETLQRMALPQTVLSHAVHQTETDEEQSLFAFLPWAAQPPTVPVPVLDVQWAAFDFPRHLDTVFTRTLDPDACSDPQIDLELRMDAEVQDRDAAYRTLLVEEQVGRLGRPETAQKVLDFARAVVLSPPDTLCGDDAHKYAALMLDALRRHVQSMKICKWGLSVLVVVYDQSTHQQQLSPVFFAACENLYQFPIFADKRTGALMLWAMAAFISPSCKVHDPNALINYCLYHILTNQTTLEPLTLEHAIAVMRHCSTTHRFREQLFFDFYGLFVFKSQPSLLICTFLAIEHMYALIQDQLASGQMDSDEELHRDVHADFPCGIPSNGRDVRIVVHTMDLYPLHRKLQGAGVICLATMGRIPICCPALCALGLRSVLYAYTHHPSSISIAENMCLLFQRLCSKCGASAISLHAITCAMCVAEQFYMDEEVVAAALVAALLLTKRSPGKETPTTLGIPKPVYTDALARCAPLYLHSPELAAVFFALAAHFQWALQSRHVTTVALASLSDADSVKNDNVIDMALRALVYSQYLRPAELATLLDIALTRPEHGAVVCACVASVGACMPLKKDGILVEAYERILTRFRKLAKMYAYQVRDPETVVQACRVVAVTSHPERIAHIVERLRSRVYAILAVCEGVTLDVCSVGALFALGLLGKGRFGAPYFKKEVTETFVGTESESWAFTGLTLQEIRDAERKIKIWDSENVKPDDRSSTGDSSLGEFEKRDTLAHPVHDIGAADGPLPASARQKHGRWSAVLRKTDPIADDDGNIIPENSLPPVQEQGIFSWIMGSAPEAAAVLQQAAAEPQSIFTQWFGASDAEAGAMVPAPPVDTALPSIRAEKLLGILREPMLGTVEETAQPSALQANQELYGDETCKPPGMKKGKASQELEGKGKGKPMPPGMKKGKADQELDGKWKGKPMPPGMKKGKMDQGFYGEWKGKPMPPGIKKGKMDQGLYGEWKGKSMPPGAKKSKADQLSGEWKGKPMPPGMEKSKEAQKLYGESSSKPMLLGMKNKGIPPSKKGKPTPP